MISSELCQNVHRDLLGRRMKIFSDAGLVALEGIIEQDRWSSANSQTAAAHSVRAILKHICCPCSKKNLNALIQESGDHSETLQSLRRRRGPKDRPPLNPKTG